MKEYARIYRVNDTTLKRSNIKCKNEYTYRYGKITLVRGGLVSLYLRRIY